MAVRDLLLPFWSAARLVRPDVLCRDGELAPSVVERTPLCYREARCVRSGWLCGARLARACGHSNPCLNLCQESFERRSRGTLCAVVAAFAVAVAFRSAGVPPAAFAFFLGLSFGTRKIKGRTRTSQLQDELPERVDGVRRVVNVGKRPCEKVAQLSPLGRSSGQRHPIGASHLEAFIPRVHAVLPRASLRRIESRESRSNPLSRWQQSRMPEPTWRSKEETRSMEYEAPL
jgi:hypothetical protein